MEFIATSGEAVKAFHKQEGVLFQFILQELLILRSQLKTLERLPQDLTPPLEAVILNTLNHLVGSQTDTFRVHWGHKKEVIPKLKSLATIFEHGDTLYSLLVSIEKELIPLSYDLPSLQNRLTHLNALMLPLEETIKTIVPFFEKDETVLFFFLRKKQLFDTAFSKGFVKNLFEEKKMLYKEVLLSQFKKRGFFELLPTIEPALDHL